MNIGRITPHHSESGYRPGNATYVDCGSVDQLIDAVATERCDVVCCDQQPIEPDRSRLLAMANTRPATDVWIRTGGHYVVAKWPVTTIVKKPDALAVHHLQPLRAIWLARWCDYLVADLLPPDVSARVRELVTQTLLASLDADNVKDVAKSVGMTDQRLRRRFATLAIANPNRFITIGKVLRAREMARMGFTVGTIAMELGFSTHSAFGSSIRRVVGVPPKRLASLREREVTKVLRVYVSRPNGGHKDIAWDKRRYDLANSRY